MTNVLDGVGRATDRQAVLSEAALRLVAGAGLDADRLAGIRELLSPLTCDPDEPQWVREALAAGLELLGCAVSGSLAHDSAIARVSTLIELVMSGAAAAGRDAAAGVSGDTSSYTLPADAARDLIPEFVAESLEYLVQTEGALLQLEADPRSSEAIDTVFRAFHTIKSTSSFLGLEPIATLAHGVESVLAGVRDGRAAFDAACADLTLDAADVMRDLLAQTCVAMEGGAFVLPPQYATLLLRLRGAPATLSAAASDGAAGATPRDAGSAAQQAGVPGAAQQADASERAARADADGWMRLRTGHVDRLVDLIGELVIAQSMVAQDPAVLADRHGGLARKVAQSGKILRELQELGMSLRLVPLRPLLQKMQRLVREVSKDAGKRVQLVVSGEETEIDRQMVDLLADPLMHMIRNAIDHGIEPPAAREAAGKDTLGTLQLSTYHAGGSVVVELHDDGRGLDLRKIRDAAVARGITDPDRELTEAEVCNLIFAPGLSTAPSLTSLSGRGVGMDVVRRNIEALHGRIDISTSADSGTTFTVRLPLTLAITDGMLVGVGAERYIIPTGAIRMIVRPSRDALTTVAGAGELATLHGSTMPILRLHALFGVADAVTLPTQGLLVVVGDAGGRHALLVDTLLGQQQFVVKPVGAAFGALPGVAGAAILGDGCVGLMLDPAALVAAR